MVLVAAMAAIGIALATRGQLADERTRSALARGEARLLARGALGTVKNLIAEEDATFDAPGDLWSRGLGWESGDGTRVEAQITDESARFPIETLWTKENGGRLDLDARDAFERLLAAMDLPVSTSDVAIDWCDPDDDPFPRGAEAATYAEAAKSDPFSVPPISFTPPMDRPANRPFRLPEEARHLAGLKPEEAARLGDAVTTLGGGKINLNTASPEVLRSLSSRIDADLARQIHARARRIPFRSLEDLAAVPGSPPGLVAEIAPRADVKSGAFRVRIRATVRGEVAEVVAVLRRGEGIETILYRE